MNMTKEQGQRIITQLLDDDHPLLINMIYYYAGEYLSKRGYIHQHIEIEHIDLEVLSMGENISYEDISDSEEEEHYYSINICYYIEGYYIDTNRQRIRFKDEDLMDFNINHKSPVIIQFFRDEKINSIL